MWTLEGLGALDAALVRELMKDADPQMRIQAIRASETLYKAGDKTLAADYAAMAKDADTDVVIQALLTINTLKVAGCPATIMQAALDAQQGQGRAARRATPILNPAASAGRGVGLESLAATTFTPEEQAMMDKGKEIYNELCFACHGDDGRGTPAPRPRHARRRRWPLRRACSATATTSSRRSCTG